MRKGIFYQISTALLSIILLLIIVKKYDTSDIANYFLMLSTYSVVRLFVDYSFNLTGIRDIKVKKFEVYYFDVIIVKIFVAIIIMAGLFIYWMITDSTFGDILYFKEIFLIAVFNSLLDIHWIVYLKDLVVKYYKLYSIFKFLFLISVLFADYDITTIVMINILIDFLIGIWLTFIVMKDVNSIRFAPNGVRQHLSDGLLSGYKNFFSLSLISIFTSSWIFFINTYGSQLMVTIYGLIEKITRFAISFFTPLFNYMISGQNAKIFDKRFSHIILFVLLLLPSQIAYLVLINTNFELFVNKNFYDYIPEIMIMLMVIPFYYYNGYFLTRSIIIKTEIISLSFYVFSLVLLFLIFMIGTKIQIFYLPLSLEVIVLIINILFFRRINNEKTY